MYDYEEEAQQPIPKEFEGLEEGEYEN